MASIVVAQMLPDAAIKGGTGLNARLGPEASRFSRDLDASRQRETSEDSYVEELKTSLGARWGGFRATAVRQSKKQLKLVPGQYVMLPVNVALTYRGSKFDTIRLELSVDELGSVPAATVEINPVLVEMFTRIGLEAPRPIPVITLEHQIAQKIHACTTPDSRGANERAHDLVDLQLLYDAGAIDLADLGRLGQRLTSFRKSGSWPPVAVARDGWGGLYAEAAEGLPVLPLDAAVVWVNDLVDAAEAARRLSDGDRNQSAPRLNPVSHRETAMSPREKTHVT